MKPMMFAAAGFAVMLAAGVAVAQVPSPPPPDAMHGPGMEHGMEHGPGGEMHGHWGMRGRMHGMMGPMRPTKAAGFMFRKGDSVVAIKCADDEPMKACVDASSALIDKMASLQK